MSEDTSVEPDAPDNRFDAISPPPEGGFDLRSVLRATGGAAWSTGASPAEARSDARVPVEVLDDGPARIGEGRLEVAGFADGVQAIRCVAWRARRPINLAYCAAGAMLDRRTVVAVNERLFLTASTADHDWVRDLPGGLPVLWVTTDAPPEVAGALHDAVASLRAHLEDTLVEDLVARGAATADVPLVVDGDLRSHARHRHGAAVVGIVKTHRTRWLPDESLLWSLRKGWRSQRFRIPAGAGVGIDRYSCYVRLHGGSDRPWNFGLIRLEATDVDQLDALAATAYANRQGPGAPDGRWDRQLGPVRAVEEYLATRRPVALRP